MNGVQHIQSVNREKSISLMFKITQEELNRRLDYDPSTGDLVWVISTSNAIKAGTKAGSIVTSGHLQMKINGQPIQVHRVIWFMLYGEWSDMIDHKDGNPLNNRKDNLRLATATQNARNRKLGSDSKTGFKGVNQIPNGKYRARIWINGSNKNLGTFDIAEEAAEAYDKAALSFFGAFAKTNKELGLI